MDIFHWISVRDIYNSSFLWLQFCLSKITLHTSLIMSEVGGGTYHWQACWPLFGTMSILNTQLVSEQGSRSPQCGFKGLICNDAHHSFSDIYLSHSLHYMLIKPSAKGKLVFLLSTSKHQFKKKSTEKQNGYINTQVCRVYVEHRAMFMLMWPPGC